VSNIINNYKVFDLLSNLIFTNLVGSISSKKPVSLVNKITNFCDLSNNWTIVNYFTFVAPGGQSHKVTSPKLFHAAGVQPTSLYSCCEYHEYIIPATSTMNPMINASPIITSNHPCRFLTIIVVVIIIAVCCM